MRTSDQDLRREVRGGRVPSWSNRGRSARGGVRARAAVVRAHDLVEHVSGAIRAVDQAGPQQLRRHPLRVRGAQFRALRDLEYRELIGKSGRASFHYEIVRRCWSTAWSSSRVDRVFRQWDAARVTLLDFQALSADRLVHNTVKSLVGFEVAEEVHPTPPARRRRTWRACCSTTSMRWSVRIWALSDVDRRAQHRRRVGQARQAEARLQRGVRRAAGGRRSCR